MKRSLIPFGLLTLVFVCVRSETAGAVDPCADFISQFSRHAPPQGEHDIEFYTGFMNAALVVTETNQIFFGTAPYISLNAHASIVSAIEAASGGPVQRYLYLGEVRRSETGFDLANEASGFAQTLPADKIQNSVFHLQNILSERTTLLSWDFQALSYVKGGSELHLDSRLNHLDMSNVRHDVLNDLSVVLPMLDLIVQSGDASLIRQFRPVFRRNRTALTVFLRLFGSAQEEPSLVRTLRVHLTRLSGRGPTLSLEEVAETARCIRTFLDVLQEPPVIFLSLGEWDNRPPKEIP